MKSKTALNADIVALTREMIIQRGLGGKLDVFSVSNTFTRRPRYWKEGAVNLFKVHLWDINCMEPELWEQEIKSRIDAACRHFGL